MVVTICMRCSEPVDRCQCQRTVPNLGRVTMDTTVDDEGSTPMAPCLQLVRVRGERPSRRA